VKSHIAENVIQKLLAHKAEDRSQTSPLAKCVKHTEIAGRFSKGDATDIVLN
jgi:hypothetical protein